jgi:hypothetical protein
VMYRDGNRNVTQRLNDGYGWRVDGMNNATILLALAIPTVTSAVAWANAGPPHVRGRLIGEPNGLEQMRPRRFRTFRSPSARDPISLA